MDDIAQKVKDNGIKNFAMILVGDFIDGDYERSKLYDSTFAHGFRGAAQ